MDVRIKENGLKFKYRVSGIIINDNKILLEKYSDKGWCLPGGYVMMGETSEKAMLRELNEEIDKEFVIDKFLGVVENFFTNFRDDKTHAIEFYYKVRFKDINDINSIDYNRVEDDHGFIINHHFKWFTLEELKTINLLPNIVIEDILDAKDILPHRIYAS